MAPHRGGRSVSTSSPTLWARSLSLARSVPGAIIAEAVLTYLGIGLRPDVDLAAPFPTSWGQMIQSGQSAYRNQPWLLIAPSLSGGTDHPLLHLSAMACATPSILAIRSDAALLKAAIGAKHM